VVVAEEASAKGCARGGAAAACMSKEDKMSDDDKALVRRLSDDARGSSVPKAPPRPLPLTRSGRSGRQSGAGHAARARHHAARAVSVTREGRPVAAPLDEPLLEPPLRSYLGRKHDHVSFRGMCMYSPPGCCGQGGVPRR
jgi:hypothetical protein